MQAMPSRLSLPGDAEDIARMQSARGRAALTVAQRAQMAGWHSETAVGDGGAEQEIVRLLTRPFSLHEPIPEYYRYTSLHVYDWFLSQYESEPVAAAVLGIRASLTDLIGREKSREDMNEDGASYLPERLNRLHTLIERVDDMIVAQDGPVRGADIEERARHDRRLQWQLFVLTRCTAFPQSSDDNEHLFLRSVHCCELAFYLVRWTACRALSAIAEDDPCAAEFRIGQVAACSELLNGIFHALKTLSPEQFMNFREATGAASAVQSLNFHLLELALFGRDPRKSEVFHRFGHLRSLNDPPYCDHWPLREAVIASGRPELRRAFDAVERSMLTWRGRHYGFGRLYLPRQLKGSGGTEGAGYLKKFMDKTNCGPGTQGPVDETMFRFAFR